MLKYRLYFFFYYLCGISYILAGVNHFVNPNFYLRIMPDYLPAHEALIRLPFQLLFLWWAWVYTRPFPQRPE